MKWILFTMAELQYTNIFAPCPRIRMCLLYFSIMDPQDIANLFNDYFNSVFTKSTCDLPNHYNSTSSILLFNKIISTSDIPQEWKMHKIIPILKKDDKLNVANYRPISLLCIPEKVLETRKSRNYFGFSKNSFCLMNILKSYTEI